jgi:hypothetical protein
MRPHPLLLLLTACATPALEEAGPQSAAFSSPPTWKGALRPIVERSCLRCHSDGSIGTSFTDPAVVQGLAPLISAYVQIGQMPPPAPDPSCQPYEGSEVFVLTPEERQLFADWAEAGAPIGSGPSPSIEEDPFVQQVDRVLQAPGPVTPVFDRTGNGYTCFVVDIGEEELVPVQAFVPLVDNDRIVHHIVLYQAVGNRGIPEDASATEGFVCNGLGGPGWVPVAAWGPGNQAFAFPPGITYILTQSTPYVLQMHYYNSFDGADQATDHTAYGLVLADEPGRAVTTLPLGPTSFRIPAGAEAHSESSTIDWSYGSYDILAVWPHMHLFGSGFSQTLTHADGAETCLLQQDDWDIHSQVTAPYLDTIPLRNGDRITTTCTWDNSPANQPLPGEQPKTVNFGEGTGDEMCFGFTYISPSPID